ncbi:hypothetical protein P73_2422 [Celeribacter indicus]|uniref:Uncharacterized protein n=1 Tax=Celeribacter indicus TaxID=1208324 RepID=A0A0B5E447_9RHOB|nr:hypothetical protein P73_2422 [Celeribacter indicus]
MRDLFPTSPERRSPGSSGDQEGRPERWAEIWDRFVDHMDDAGSGMGEFRPFRWSPTTDTA